MIDITEGMVVAEIRLLEACRVDGYPAPELGPATEDLDVYRLQSLAFILHTDDDGHQLTSIESPWFSPILIDHTILYKADPAMIDLHVRDGVLVEIEIHVQNGKARYRVRQDYPIHTRRFLCDLVYSEIDEDVLQRYFQEECTQ